MKVPKGYSEDEVLSIIRKIIQRYRGFAFDIYDGDDIEQEAFLIAVDGLERYKPEYKNLENFLAVHVKNRLINFVDKHNSTRSNKFKINHAIPLESVDDENESKMVVNELPENYLMKEEFIEQLNEVIPVENRMDYLKMTRGIKVSKVRRNKVIKFIKEYFKNNGEQSW